MRTLSFLAGCALLASCGGPPASDNGASPAANTPVAANNAAPAPAPVAAPSAEAAASYLPAPGRHAARAMTLAPPPEAIALRDRMAAAIMRNAAWFDGYAAQHPEGELPWHANLGISEADYGRYLALTRRISLTEQARVTLNVTRRADGGLALAVSGGAAALNGIILYPERGRVETPLGQLGTRAAAGNDAAESPLGRWQGAQWSNRGSGSARLLSLSAGRRATGDMLLYYNYGPSDAETVILLYPAPAPAR